MSRERRIIEPGTTYHLISRFIDRRWFIKGDDERRLYLHLLGQALARSDWRCLAYAVMSNHLHLAVIAGEQPLASWLRRVHSPFATALNRTHDRIGPMFVRGPKSLAVDRFSIGSVISYIHNNPVRANLVDIASDSDWTSHRAYLGLAPTPRWLHARAGLRLARFANAMTFDAWVRDPERVAFDALHEQLVTQHVPVHRQPPVHVEPFRVVSATASELGISSTRLASIRRGNVEVLGREVAVRCATQIGLSGAQIARALGITQQAVSRILVRSGGDDAHALTARVLQRLDAASL